MSDKLKAIEDALYAALTLPAPVAARVSRGDAFPLPIQSVDGALIRVTGLSSLEAAMFDDVSLATVGAELELHRLGPADTSAAVALASLLTAAHARLLADRTLGGACQWLALEESSPIAFETQSGGEQPAYSCTVRYQIHCNFNPITLGA